MKLENGKCTACGKAITEAESLIVFHIKRKNKEVTTTLQYHSVYGQPYLYTCASAVNATYYENGAQIDVFHVQGYTLDVIESFKSFHKPEAFTKEAMIQIEAIRDGYYQTKANELPDPMPRMHQMQAELDARYDDAVRSAITKFSNAFEKRKEYAECGYEDTIRITLVRACKNSFEKCVMLHYDDGGNRFSRYIPSSCMQYTCEQDLTFLTILKKLCGSKTRDMRETAKFLNEQLDKVANPFAALNLLRIAIESKSISPKTDFEALKTEIADVLSSPGAQKRKVLKL